jgi:hypothetical protein
VLVDPGPLAARHDVADVLAHQVSDVDCRVCTECEGQFVELVAATAMEYS